MNENEFATGSVPVMVAARIYGKDASWVRAGIISGWLPIGKATRNGQLVTKIEDMNSKYGRINFYISPKRLYEETGYVWKGENRYDDGIDLRYRFGNEQGYRDSMIASYLDNRPCSVLEMIIALAIRLEEHIMDDPDIGNRTGQWFWDMIVSLGLGSMDDSKFDKAHAIDVIRRFLDRDYGRDGKGGLFTIEHCRYDMRDIEIWYQANWYLDNIR